MQRSHGNISLYTVSHIPQSVPDSHHTIPEVGTACLLYLYTNTPPELVRQRGNKGNNQSPRRKTRPSEQKPPKKIITQPRGKTWTSKQKPPLHHSILVLKNTTITWGGKTRPSERKPSPKLLSFRNARSGQLYVAQGNVLLDPCPTK